MNISLIFADDLKVGDWDFPIMHVLDTVIPRLLGGTKDICLHYHYNVRSKVITYTSDRFKSLNYNCWGPERPKSEWYAWTECRDSHINFWLHEMSELIIYVASEKSPKLPYNTMKSKRYVRFNPHSNALKSYE